MAEELDTLADAGTAAVPPAVVDTPSAPDVPQDDVRTAIAQLRGEDGDVTAVQDGAAPDRKTTDAAPSTDERPRRADGTFAPKDSSKTEAAPATTAKAAPATKIPAQDNAAKVTADATASTPSGNPPAGWAADAKADWSKVSPAVQAAVIKREAEIDAGGRQWSEQRRQYEGMLTPIAQEAQRNGLSVDQGIKALMDAHHALNANPVSAIQHFMQTYGVSLEQLSSAPAPQPQPRVDPMLATVLNKVDSLERSLEESRTAPVVNMVTDFAGKQPHWAAVQTEVQNLIPVIQAQNPGASPQSVLEAAYDHACWANPNVRAAMLSERDATAAATRTQTLAAKQTQARRAAISIPRSPSGPPPARNGAVPGGDVFDDVRAAIAQHSGGV